MKKIIFISHDASRSGAPIVLLNFLKWFKSNSNIPFEIILGRGGPLEAEFNELAPTIVFSTYIRPNLFIRKLKYIFLFFNLNTLYEKIINYLASCALKRKYAANEIGLIYSNTVTNSKIIQSMNWLNCPILSHVHELEYVIELCGKENLDHLVRTTDKFIACSYIVKFNLMQLYGIPEDKIDVIYEFIPSKGNISFNRNSKKSDYVNQVLDIPKDAFIVGSSGSIEWRKGSDLFVQIANIVIRKYSKPIYFIWLGGNQQSHQYIEFLYDIRKLNLDKYVRTIPSQPNPLDYMNCFDIFLLPSREDPYPLVCLEAASLKKPVLCFDRAGGMPEFVGNQCGCVVDYLDLDMMASKIIQLYNDQDQLKEMGESAANKVSENHFVEQSALKIMCLIDDLL